MLYSCYIYHIVPPITKKSAFLGSLAAHILHGHHISQLPHQVAVDFRERLQKVKAGKDGSLPALKLHAGSGAEMGRQGWKVQGNSVGFRLLGWSGLSNVSVLDDKAHKRR